MKLSSAYHPQTDNQIEVVNWGVGVFVLGSIGNEQKGWPVQSFGTIPSFIILQAWQPLGYWWERPPHFVSISEGRFQSERS